MAIIQQGRTKELPGMFWHICDDAQERIAVFNHDRFPHILSGVDVYFIDLNLDGLCENVQVVMYVDEVICMATPVYGIETDAESTLRDYVMSALLDALNKQGSARTEYLDQLKKKMNSVRYNAESQGSSVTLEILYPNGIG